MGFNLKTSVVTLSLLAGMGFSQKCYQNTVDTPPVATPTTNTLSPYARQQAFDEVWDLINKSYVYPDFGGLNWADQKKNYLPKIKDAKNDQEVWGLIGQMVDDLNDGHSWYLSPELRTSDDLEMQGQASYVGIGIDNTLTDEGILVQHVFLNSPAAQGGLKPRDVIVAINGQRCPTSNMVRGAKGTSLKVTVSRPDVDAPIELTLTRDEIVTGLEPEGKRIGKNSSIGYVVLPTFDDENVPAQMEQVLQGLLSGQPLEGLIVDVRGNGGGLLWACEKVYGLFREGRMGRFNTRFGKGLSIIARPSKLYRLLKNVPVVVLADQNSHSAAEVFAGAMQLSGATVIGRTTAANTESISRHDFLDGSAIYLAKNDFFLNNGVRLGEKGVIPDVEVIENWYQYSEQRDPMILAALERLNAR